MVLYKYNNIFSELEEHSDNDSYKTEGGGAERRPDLHYKIVNNSRIGQQSKTFILLKCSCIADELGDKYCKSKKKKD